MAPEDASEFRNTIAGMARLFGSDPDSALLDIYWLALKNWPIEDFRDAAAQLINTCEFMPKPAQFHALRKAGDDTGGEAFASIRRWLIYSPRGYTLDPDCPRKMASCIMAIGGPQAIAMCESEKLNFLERRFCDHWDEIGDRISDRAALGFTAPDAPLLRQDHPQ
jgi:hypothetical protein